MNSDEKPYKKRFDNNVSGEKSFQKRDSFQGGFKKRFGSDNNESGGFKKRFDNNESGEKSSFGGFKKRFDNNESGEKSFSQNDSVENREQPISYPSVRKNDKIRLNRYIALSGICSRRDADEMIEKGKVKVNGQIVKQLGTIVGYKDEVTVEGKTIQPEQYVYILMNKPKNMITSMDDPEGRQTVMDLLQDHVEERVFPVGRLDRNTTGLLLLTNDGTLTKKLTHPSHNVRKLYKVVLDQKISPKDIEKIRSGIELEDGFAQADAIDYVEGGDKTEVGIEIHSGRNRLVRRIFEHLGYQVKALDRVMIGFLTKRGLPRGEWRYLTPKEINFLKMM